MKLKDIAFAKKRIVMAMRGALSAPVTTVSAAVLASSMIVAPAVAQQTSGITGKVTGDAVAGVTVTARGDAMPRPRSTTTKADGSFDLPALLPGNYELTFTAEDGTRSTMNVRVLLDQTANITVPLQARDPSVADTEVITITGSLIVRQGDSSLTNSLGDDVVTGVPVGQDYRDLLKLVPGVEFSQNSTRGPSAGGSGQDNKYGFDGVDVSLPLFGNLASEPSTHDVANVSMDRGGAKAVGFNRSGGFSINTTSKSGTNEFKGRVEYKLQNANFGSTPDVGVIRETDESWITANLGGPLIEDELFFYVSYYRPEEEGANTETRYGPAKDYRNVRDEYFGKLTWAPTDDLLFNASLRTSDRTIEGNSIGEFETDSVSVGGTSEQDIFTIDGSWLIDDFTTLSFSYNTFELVGGDAPDNQLSVTPTIGGSLDLANLDQMGYFNVPSLRDDEPGFNAGAQALINQYGYIGDDGNPAGGGGVGGYFQFNNQDFYRDTFELALDHEFEIGNAFHNLHVGFKYSEIEEDLSRFSNGWGSFEYIGGLEEAPDGTPIYYRSITERVSFGSGVDVAVPSISSSAKAYNLEINDTIEYQDFTFNVGVLISQDELYGQGLRPKSGTVSGYEQAPGHKYKMYTVDWQDMIQPRLGVSWEYEAGNTVFANFASYNPEASSLARAASWDRSALAQLDVYFDEDGNYIDSEPRGGSSGKVFADDLEPRRIDEITIGTTKAVSNNLFLRAHARHRKGTNFWEDMPNNARLYGTYGNSSVPDHIAAKGLYVDNLDAIRDEISGSSYVIAEVDGGETKYWELSLEAEWQGDRTYLNASYVWSHYYGNFDQDNTTTTNDANTFIGSSFYGDGPGRLPWDNRYGKLRGDKPHLFKAFGYYTTDWNANIGAYLVYQSGHPWEAWDATYYGYASTVSSTSRYGEPAGSRRTASHWQLDLNYTQDVRLTDTFTAQFRADLFNVFDRQTGYNPNPFVTSENFGESRNFYNPRRLQLSVAVEF
ncbi:carboxypeptidase regulatory-like domain-containing protein [Lacimicrobium alkaliphilum]|uniref:TonB-dependent receptor n=1 Tax=Lacimicrobium alkaliphilum TaxID=1526571 RepID=A0A0U2Z9M5_9ALTE|nr:carboxypeptidase regulatory-like domain-containing protein [Lacimicrobium alkaliphilum]ALS99124.1 TonB-dependent receptor [Lacimicrobium alkaliphilum]